MLKRARIALLSAVVPGLLAYTGVVDVDMLTTVARIVFFTLIGFSIVSFLLSFFDDEPEPALAPELAAVPVSTASQAIVKPILQPVVQAIPLSPEPGPTLRVAP